MNEGINHWYPKLKGGSRISPVLTECDLICRNLKDTTKMILELICEFSKVTKDTKSTLKIICNSVY